MKTIFQTTLLVLSYFVVFNNGANILALFPMVSKSHTIIGNDLAETLAKRGHNVTHISPFPRGTKIPNYNEVNLTDFVNPFIEKFHTKLLNDFHNILVGREDSSGKIKWLADNLVTHTTNSYKLITTLTDIVLRDRNLQHILNSNQHFDVVIMGAFAQEALLGIGHHFKAPMIITVPPGMNIFVDHLIGNPAPYSYVPNILLDATDDMTFSQRLINTIFNVFINLYQNFVHFPAQNKLLQKYFPNASDIFDLTKNISIVLSNSHESIAYPRPLVPNVVQIGSIHVEKPKSLPTDLQKFMDDTPYGVIYFSFGSNVRSKDISIEIKNSFVKVFAKLKHKVLWKWDELTISGLSKNVRLSKWYPQNDILAHPKMKLFMTHGGLLSTTETIVRGVPMIGIPQFADQFINTKRASDLGFCVILNYHNITEESVSAAINEVLFNKKYYENVKKRSDIINDQIVHPLDKAVYWIEFVIRHKGAAHLRTAGADLPLYKYLLLDVVGFILIILILIFCVIYFIVKKLLLMLKKDTKYVKSKKKKRKTD